MIAKICFILMIAAWFKRGAFTSTFCPNQICDNSGLITDKDVNRFESEICTWENIINFLPSSCWKFQCEQEEWKTGFFISASRIDSNIIGTYNYWLLGKCDNVDVLLYTKYLSNCTGNIDIESSPDFLLTKSLINLTSPDHILHLMSTMLRVFYGYTVENPIVDFKFLQWNTVTRNNCKIIRGVIPSPSIPSSDQPELTDVPETYLEINQSSSTVTIDFTTIQNSSHSDLTRHSHHGSGGIIEAILYIVCALCGTTALSCLLYFRRVRHCICSTCGLCRVTQNLLISDTD